MLGEYPGGKEYRHLGGILGSSSITGLQILLCLCSCMQYGLCWSGGGHLGVDLFLKYLDQCIFRRPAVASLKRLVLLTEREIFIRPKAYRRATLGVMRLSARQNAFKVSAWTILPTHLPCMMPLIYPTCLTNRLRQGRT